MSVRVCVPVCAAYNNNKFQFFTLALAFQLRGMGRKGRRQPLSSLRSAIYAHYARWLNKFITQTHTDTHAHTRTLTHICNQGQSPLRVFSLLGEVKLKRAFALFSLSGFTSSLTWTRYSCLNPPAMRDNPFQHIHTHDFICVSCLRLCLVCA